VILEKRTKRKPKSCWRY